MADMKLVTSEIIGALNRGGAMEFEDLLKAVGKTHGDIDERTLEAHLMEMEIQGLVRVSKMARGRRRIELA